MREERMFEEGSDADDEYYKSSAYIMDQKNKKCAQKGAQLAKKIKDKDG
jgi:hypothetical protein